MASRNIPWIFRTRALFFLGATSVFAASFSVLSLIGFSMGDDRAGLLARLHPAFYLLLPFLFGLISVRAASGYEPEAASQHKVHRSKARWQFALSVTAIAAVAGALLGVTNGSVANLSTTFLLPILVAAGLPHLTSKELRALARVVLTIMLINSTIGIIEKTFDYRLLAFTIGTEEKLNDPRPTALFSHPLNNALLTSLTLIFLLYGYHPKSQMAKLLKLAIIPLHAYALICFGGRSAVVALGLVITIEYIYSGWKIIATGRGAAIFARKTIIAIVSATILATAMFGGVFDAFLERFMDDRGSAEVRWASLLIFRDLDMTSTLTGFNNYQLDSILGYYGIPTIELAWQSLALKNGIVVTALIAITLSGFLYYLSRTEGKPTGYMALVFGLVTFGFASIASSSLLVSQLIIMMISLPSLTARTK